MLDREIETPQDILEISNVMIQRRLTRNALDGSVKEAFQIYILMNSLMDSLPETCGHLLNKEVLTLQQMKAVEFIKQNIGRIEVSVNNVLQRVYFTVKPECRELSVELRDRFVINVDRESQQTKVAELMEAVPDFLDEMDANWELKLSAIPITP